MVAPCRFGIDCQRPNCAFGHAETRRIDLPNAGGNQNNKNGGAGSSSTSSNNNQSTGGTFFPPGTEKIPCRFGIRCTRIGCVFEHASGRLVDGTASANAWGDGADTKTQEETISRCEQEVTQKEANGNKDEVIDSLLKVLAAYVAAGKAEKAVETARKLRSLEGSSSKIVVKDYSSLVQLLCLHDSDIRRAWEIFLDLRKHWVKAQYDKDGEASFSAFNRPYQVAFDAMLAKIGPPTVMPSLIPRVRSLCDAELKGEHPSLSVMSFNVLADGFSREFSYQFVCLEDFDFLRWECRLPLILGEILRAGADIVCLQEVDSRHFPEIQRAMCHRGYAGVFSQRTTRDGVAIFFLAASFRTVHRETIADCGASIMVLQSLALNQGETVKAPVDTTAAAAPAPAASEKQQDGEQQQQQQEEEDEEKKKKEEEEEKKRIERDREASAAAAAKDPTRNEPWGIVIANAHFSYTHNSEQPKKLLEALNKVSATYPRYGRICCGDLNGLNAEEQKLFEAAGFNNSYAANKHSMASGAATRCTAHTTVDRRGGELDFIWTSKGFQPVAVLQIPDDHVEVLRAEDPVTNPRRSLPNPHYPSDHIALCAQFAVLDAHVAVGKEAQAPVTSATLLSNQSRLLGMRMTRGRGRGRAPHYDATRRRTNRKPISTSAGENGPATGEANDNVPSESPVESAPSS